MFVQIFQIQFQIFNTQFFIFNNSFKISNIMFFKNFAFILFFALIRRVIFFEWKFICFKFKMTIYFCVFCFDKLNEKKIKKLLKKIFQTNLIDSENILYRKTIFKIKSNQTTWKHRNLTIMKIIFIFMFSVW